MGCRCAVRRSRLRIAVYLCDCPLLSLEWDLSFVLVLISRAWKARWRARWTNQSPGVGLSRICTEGATCPPPWATACPAQEDILRCGEFREPEGGAFTGQCWDSRAPHFCGWSCTTQCCIFPHSTCISGEAKESFFGRSWDHD